jgi:hypothetical protein
MGLHCGNDESSDLYFFIEEAIKQSIGLKCRLMPYFCDHQDYDGHDEIWIFVGGSFWSRLCCIVRFLLGRSFDRYYIRVSYNVEKYKWDRRRYINNLDDNYKYMLHVGSVHLHYHFGDITKNALFRKQNKANFDLLRAIFIVFYSLADMIACLDFLFCLRVFDYYVTWGWSPTDPRCKEYSHIGIVDIRDPDSYKDLMALLKRGLENR